MSDPLGSRVDSLPRSPLDKGWAARVQTDGIKCIFHLKRLGGTAGICTITDFQKVPKAYAYEKTIMIKL